METRISKSFKQFLLELEPDVRAGVYAQIIGQCHVTAASLRMWAREDSAPQKWRVKAINSIAKRHGCVIKFNSSKRKSQLSGI